MAYKTRFHFSVVDGKLYKASDLSKEAKNSNQFPFVFERNSEPAYEASLVQDGKRTLTWYEYRKPKTLTFEIPQEKFIRATFMHVFSNGMALEAALDVDAVDPRIINLSENLAKWVKIENISDPYKGNGKVWYAGNYFVRMQNPHKNIDFGKYREMAKTMLSKYGEVASKMLFDDYLTLKRAKELIGKKVTLGYDSTNIGSFVAEISEIEEITETLGTGKIMRSICLGVYEFAKNGEYVLPYDEHYSFDPKTSRKYYHSHSWDSKVDLSSGELFSIVDKSYESKKLPTFNELSKKHNPNGLLDYVETTSIPTKQYFLYFGGDCFVRGSGAEAVFVIKIH